MAADKQITKNSDASESS